MDPDERTDRLIRELAAEKQAQIEGAKVVLKPLSFVVSIAVFVTCFWWYGLSLLLSIGAAIVTMLIVAVAISLLVGYVLGKRAAQRFKARLRDAD